MNKDEIITYKYNEKPLNIRTENRIFTNEFSIRELEFAKRTLKDNHIKNIRTINEKIKRLNECIDKDMKELDWVE